MLMSQLVIHLMQGFNTAEIEEIFPHLVACRPEI